MQRRPQSTVLIAWISAVFVLGGYVVLRYVISTPVAIGYAQLFYLMGPLLAATFAAASASAAAPRSRTRTGWSLLSASMTLLVISEALYSWQAVFGGVEGQGLGLADLSNLLGGLMIIAMMAVLAGLDLKGRRRFLLLTFSMLIVALPVCTVLFAFWIRTTPSAADPFGTLTMMAYSTLGVFLLLLGALTWVEMGPVRNNTPSRLIAAAVVIYATTLVFWPAWMSAALDDGTGPGSGIVVSTSFLVAYLLVFLASVHQFESGESEWVSAPHPIHRAPTPWIDMTVSVSAVLTVVASGWAAYLAPPDSAARLFYITVQFTSAALMVGRTMLLAAHDSRLKSRLVTDRITGAQNPRGFESRIAEYVAAATRFGESFVLVVVDLDDFAQLNESRGTDVADHVLACVADALRTAHESTGHVFRLSGDEFAVLVPIDGSTEAVQAATRVRGLVRLADTGGIPLDCSVGFAVCPDDAVRYETLMERAGQALSAAKSRGGGRVLRYDESIGRQTFTDADGCCSDSNSRMELTRALSAAADARDPASSSHSRHVATMVRLLAERLGFEPEHIERVQIAGLLHDVGKIAIPAHHGPTRLSAVAKAERQREHCVLGARMVESLGLAGVPEWILCHHERWDGKGYPDGLRGNAIPLEARMISLANFYDSRVSGTHFGAPMTARAALQEIDLGIGTRFEPDLAEQFIEMVSSAEMVATTERWSSE